MGQRLAAGHRLDQRLPVAAGQARQRQLHDVGMAGPGRAELGPEGDQHQDRQALHPLDQQIERLEARRVDPVHVLIEDKHRLPGRQALDLVDQDLEGALLLALRAERRRRVALAGLEPEQRGDQQHRLAERFGAPSEQGFELVEPGVCPVVAGKPGRALQEADDGIERAVGVVRRAVVAERRVRLAGETLAERAHDPRFADPRLTREQHYLAFALLGALPPVREQIDLVLAADQCRELLAVHGLEPALGSSSPRAPARPEPAQRNP